MAQFALPSIEYDQVELVKNDEDAIDKRVYSKDGKTLLEVHFPYNGYIQTYCSRSHASIDSIYLYRGENMVQIKFLKGDVKELTKWKLSGRVLTTEVYHDELLTKRYTQNTKLNGLNPAPPCSYSSQSYLIGSYVSNREDSPENSSRDYSTGKNLDHVLNTPMHLALYDLKRKADQIVIENYGEDFFSEYIRTNYFLSQAYHLGSPRSNRSELPIVRLDDGWFADYSQNHNLTYADITYDIVLSEEDRFPLIRIRLDKDGNMIEALDDSRKSFTKGLLMKPPVDLMSRDEILRYARENGLSANDEDLHVSLIWQGDDINTARGVLKFEILFKRLVKKVWGCTMVYYDKWLIDPISKEIDKTGEYKSGQCMESSTRVAKNSTNGKYGIEDYLFRDTLVSFNYDYIQNWMSYSMIAKRGGLYGLINHQEQILMPFIYDRLDWLKTDKERYKEEFCSVYKDGLIGVALKNGEIIVEPIYSLIYAEDGVIVMQGKTGKRELVMEEFVNLF